ncbi:MAG: RNA-binding S4 domain-containing protein [Alphaproteobacteria bacterium]|nr:RNA-binding S4 domain-containing protein [Alphaproteobacteria bacterium]
MAESLRLDRWLWFARFFKSRTLAAEACASHRVRCNGAPVAKPGASIRVGDVLTFSLGPHVRVVKVLATGTRRGPFAEARQLYEDLSPPTAAAAPSSIPAVGQRERGEGRPTKAERRAIDRLQGKDLEES